MVVQTLVAACVVMLMSLVGAVSAWGVLGRWITKHLHYLISFSAGVFLVVALGLGREVFETIPTGHAFAFVVIGALLFFVFGKLIPESHHHHEPGSVDHTHSRKGGQRIMFADALHNIADGIVLTAAFVTSVEVGIAVTVGIIVHEAIQEISEFFVLREVGYSTRGALIRNILVSATILIGVGIGVFLSQVAGIEPALLALATGGFLYVVFVDLVPSSFSVCRSKYCVPVHVVWGIVGIAVMVGVGAVTTSIGVQHGEDGFGNVLCPTDAKICPDGSAVGRTGTECAFTACTD